MSKLDVRAKRMLLVGYEGESSNYRLYDPISKKVIVSRDVVFNERLGKITLSTNEDQDDAPWLPKADLEDHPQGEENQGEDEDDVFLPVEEDEAQAREEPAVQARPIEAELGVPLSYEEPMQSNEASEWIEAIRNELKAYQENEWRVVERKPGMTIIDTKWVFRLMKDAGGNVYGYKARLCARGFMQQPVIDFEETFAPVVR
ncbi:hypothetical protein DMN91_003286 [Ooceraea biroi]|uniref:Uncharacterized protein n=1 Tax=Ooceraea biroi TaxID=2015173 RepID=A0A3L8DXJ4_OOCBI|nr:hypothetical protein DMN91_003286 [Ooceraea biroi]